MTWVGKLFHRDDGRSARLQRAKTQRDEALQELTEVRKLAASNRRHEDNNHFGERIAAAFAAKDRRERPA